MDRPPVHVTPREVKRSLIRIPTPKRKPKRNLFVTPRKKVNVSEKSTQTKSFTEDFSVKDFDMAPLENQSNRFKIPAGKITRAIKSVDPFLSKVGNSLDSHLNTVSPRWKYLTNLLLRVPLIFIIHQWALLSPTSSYWIIEHILFAIRCLGSVILFGMWALRPKTMLPMYFSVGTAIGFGWILQLNYRMYQNEADGICDTWWDEREAPWWTGSLFTIVFQILYILYLIQKFDKCANLYIFDICVVGATIIPHLFCMTASFISVSAPLFYWLTKVIFIVTAFGQVVSYYSSSGLLSRVSTQEGLQQLNPGKWLMGHLLVTFTLVYYCLCVLSDAVGSRPIKIFSVSYLTSFPGDWCTSLVIAVGLSACFGFLSNLLLALSRYLITGQRDFAAAFAAAVFDINIGGLVNLAVVSFFLEADIVTAEDELRLKSFKAVSFLAFYTILLHIWVMTEQQCHVVANDGEFYTGLAYLRVLLFAGIITVVPTIVTFRAATYLELDVWMLLNVSGTIVILWRAVCSLVELALGSVAWHVDNHLDKIEDLIHFTRLFKNLMTAVISAMRAYYYLFAPFFTTSFLLRLFPAVCNVCVIAFFFVYREWVGFQNRRTFLKKLDTIPGATEEQLHELNDVCSICFAEMTEGKVLQCSHIFHTACLRKWFQVRSTCPLCNVAAF